MLLAAEGSFHRRPLRKAPAPTRTQAQQNPCSICGLQPPRKRRRRFAKTLARAAAATDTGPAEVQRRSSDGLRQTSGPNGATVLFEIDETGKERKPFHRRLTGAARWADHEAAELVFGQMKEANIQPGPRAFHSLIFSYVKANCNEDALQAIRRAWSDGLAPLTESYCLVIAAFVKDGNYRVAKAVFESMVRSGMDARSGWLTLTKTCILAGLTLPAWQQLMQGQKNDWLPDDQLCELLIEVFCRSSKRLDRAMRFVRSDMPAMGIMPTTRHGNALVRGFAITNRPFMAGWPLQLVTDGMLGPRCRPDTNTFNAIMEGIVYHKRQTNMHGEDNPFGESMELIKAEALAHGCRPNKLMHALYCEAYMLFGRELEAMEAFRDMVELAAKGTATEYVTDLILIMLMKTNACDSRPAAVLDVLLAMWSDGRRIHPSALMPIDNSEQTILTIWINKWLGARRTAYRMPGKLEITDLNEPLVEKEIDGEMVQLSKELSAAVDPEEPNKPLPLSKLTPAQMQAELEMRGLQLTGSRKDLQRRIQAARLAPPKLLLSGLRKQQEARNAREERHRERVIERQKKQGKMKTYKWQWAEYSEDQRLPGSERTEFTTSRVVPSTQQANRDASAAAAPSRFDDEAIDLRKLRAVGRGGTAASEKDGEDDEEEDEAEDDDVASDPFVISLADDIEPLGPSLYEPQPFWPVHFRAAEMGLVMTDLAIRLGGAPSFSDFCQLIVAAKQEGDAESAYGVAKLLHGLVGDAHPEEVTWLYVGCIDVCADADRGDLADAINFDMEEQGFTMAALLPERERQQAEQGMEMYQELVHEEVALSDEEVERMQRGEGGEYDLEAAMGVADPFLSRLEVAMLLQPDERQGAQEAGQQDADEPAVEHAAEDAAEGNVLTDVSEDEQNWEYR